MKTVNHNQQYLKSLLWLTPCNLSEHLNLSLGQTTTWLYDACLMDRDKKRVTPLASLLGMVWSNQSLGIEPLYPRFHSRKVEQWLMLYRSLSVQKKRSYHRAARLVNRPRNLEALKAVQQDPAAIRHLQAWMIEFNRVESYRYRSTLMKHYQKLLVVMSSLDQSQCV